jgi:hypothetical protein
MCHGLQFIVLKSLIIAKNANYFVRCCLGLNFTLNLHPFKLI